MEIGYVIRDAREWEVDPERTASKLDAGYYRGPLKKKLGQRWRLFRDGLETTLVWLVIV